jgi:MFS family permease
VEHSCQRCGSAVDDNLPFCPSCEAPQIRFSPREVSLKSVVVAPVADAFAPVYFRVESPSYEAPSRSSFDWRGAVRPALSAGVIAAVLSLLPLISLLALPIGGFLSVVFFRRTSVRKPSSTMGFSLGALSGVFCAVILALIKTARVFLSHSENEIRDDLVRRVHLAQARNSDPQLTQLWGYLQTPQGMVFMMIFGIIFTGVIFALLSGIGGAVSAAMLRRKDARPHR